MTASDPAGEARRLHKQVHAFRAAHFRASDHLRVLNYCLGGLLILVSAVVSGSVLHASHGNPSSSLKLAAGILAIVVTVLTAVQTTFKLGERGEQHRSAADGFGRVERELEIFMGRYAGSTDGATWDELGKLAEDISQVEAGAPGYMGWTYRRGKERADD